ncbi:hypothetical protein EDD16DRAFT_1009755 [Pisolithus croceorrhizus]|nr:hypothetical protein EDD16DRAFT_1009755 [Pisolithus croceorrhizus]KAI6125209.1 hypothetical protein EV401DRAFT_1939861 [Pisolithus croceorrhizus]KAI6161491.1 hypothetical protein EDD17DRAFT_691175 [Pisolithus thermaeus]
MPPNALYLPRPPAPMRPDWNVQDIGVNDSITSYRPHLVEGSGRSPTVQSSEPPPPDRGSLPVHDTAQVGAPTLTVEYGLSTLGGHRGYREEQTFDEPNELRFLPSGHVPFPTPTCPPILPNIADETTMNVGTEPLAMYYTAPQPGHEGNHEWVGGNCYGSGNVASLPPCPVECWHQQPHSFHVPHHQDIGNLSMHGGSPAANHSNTGPSTNAPAADVPRNHVAGKRCGWRGDGGIECGVLVTYDNLAHHFATFHGVRNIASAVEITCRWCSPGKVIKRVSILRHLREYHLRYRRRKRGVAPPSPQFPLVTHSH